MNISLRPAIAGDFEFARNLYYQTMRWIIEQLFGWDEAAEDAKFVRQFVFSDVRIIIVDGEDVGCLQTVEEQDALFLQQIYVAADYQRRGIGMCDDAPLRRGRAMRQIGQSGGREDQSGAQPLRKTWFPHHAGGRVQVEGSIIVRSSLERAHDCFR